MEACVSPRWYLCVRTWVVCLVGCCCCFLLALFVCTHTCVCIYDREMTIPPVNLHHFACFCKLVLVGDSVKWILYSYEDTTFPSRTLNWFCKVWVSGFSLFTSASQPCGPGRLSDLQSDCKIHSVIKFCSHLQTHGQSFYTCSGGEKWPQSSTISIRVLQRQKQLSVV